jgi:predicted ATPase
VFVTGEAGIGKTTVVEAFFDGLDPAILRTRGQCREQYGAGEPFLPLLDALDGSATTRTPAPRSARCSRASPRVGSRRFRVFGGDGASPTSSRTRMLLELVEALEGLTARAPLVLVLEDLHWSDYSTLDLLAHLAHRTESVRLLVIATYRPVELVVHGHPLRRLKIDLELRRRCREVALEFLSETEIEAYLHLRLATEALPDGLAAFVLARTDGNPLFMTHVVDLLLARGWLVEHPKGWRFAVDPARASEIVPDTLRQMIAQEIASLAEYEQRVLEAASVAEPSRAPRPSRAALAEADDDRRGHARRARAPRSADRRVRRRCMVRRDPHGALTFIHALNQNLLYERMPLARRRELHERIHAHFRERLDHRRRARCPDDPRRPRAHPQDVMRATTRRRSRP